MLSRFQMEQQIRTSQLIREANVAKQAELATPKPVRVTGSVGVQSQFFMRRFGNILKRLQTQPA